MEQELLNANFDQNSNRGEGKEISWLQEWIDAMSNIEVLSDVEWAAQEVERRAARVIEIAQCESIVAESSANLDRCEQALAAAVEALIGEQEFNPESNAGIVTATQELADARERWNNDAVKMFIEIRYLRRMNGDWSKFCAPPISH